MVAASQQTARFGLASVTEGGDEEAGLGGEREPLRTCELSSAPVSAQPP